MNQLIVLTAILTPVAALLSAGASAQGNCEDFMAVIEEKMEASREEQAQALEHLHSAQRAMEDNNYEECFEELRRAEREIDLINKRDCPGPSCPSNFGSY